VETFLRAVHSIAFGTPVQFYTDTEQKEQFFSYFYRSRHMHIL